MVIHKRHHDKIILALYIITTLLAIATWWIVVSPLPNIERGVYQRYNTFRMYEDGSFVAEDRNGEKILGCAIGGLCND